MQRVRQILSLALPILAMVGGMLENLDSNTTGTDDKTATAIKYCIRVINAVVNEQELPQVPESLQ